MKPSYEDLEKQINELKIQLEKNQKILDQQYIYHKKCDFIVNNLPDIIYQLDKESKIVFINNTISRYGFLPEELIGKNIQEIVFPDDWELANHHLNERRTGHRKNTGLRITASKQKQSHTTPRHTVGRNRQYPLFSHFCCRCLYYR